MELQNTIALVTANSGFEPSMETFIDASFHGIVKINGLEEYTAVQTLSLHHNSLRSLGEDEAIPVSVQELYLSHNFLRDIRGIEHLSKLSILSAPHNSIEDLSAACDLAGLRVIDVSANKLQSLDSLVDGPSNLYALYLSENSIRHLRLGTPNDSLQRVVASHNKLVDIRTSDFPRVQEVNLDYNDLSSFEGWEVWMDLRRASARNNSIRSHVKLFLPMLEEIDIASNQIDRLDVFAACTSLRTLSVAVNDLTGVLDIPPALNKLESLNVANNDITHINGLEHCPRMRQLLLANNSIGDVDALINSIRGLTGLEEFDTRGNPFCDTFYPDVPLRGANLNGDPVHGVEFYDEHWPLASGGEAFANRLRYRSQVIITCIHLEHLDNIKISAAEREVVRVVREEADNAGSPLRSVSVSHEHESVLSSLLSRARENHPPTSATPNVNVQVDMSQYQQSTPGSRAAVNLSTTSSAASRVHLPDPLVALASPQPIAGDVYEDARLELRAEIGRELNGSVSGSATPIRPALSSTPGRPKGHVSFAPPPNATPSPAPPRPSSAHGSRASPGRSPARGSSLTATLRSPQRTGTSPNRRQSAPSSMSPSVSSPVRRKAPQESPGSPPTPSLQAPDILHELAGQQGIDSPSSPAPSAPVPRHFSPSANRLPESDHLEWFGRAGQAQRAARRSPGSPGEGADAPGFDQNKLAVLRARSDARQRVVRERAERRRQNQHRQHTAVDHPSMQPLWYATKHSTRRTVTSTSSSQRTTRSGVNSYGRPLTAAGGSRSSSGNRRRRRSSDLTGWGDDSDDQPQRESHLGMTWRDASGMQQRQSSPSRREGAPRDHGVPSELSPAPQPKGNGVAWSIDLGARGGGTGRPQRPIPRPHSARPAPSRRTRPSPAPRPSTAQRNRGRPSNVGAPDEVYAVKGNLRDWQNSLRRKVIPPTRDANAAKRKYYPVQGMGAEAEARARAARNRRGMARRAMSAGPPRATARYRLKGTQSDWQHSLRRSVQRARSLSPDHHDHHEEHHHHFDEETEQRRTSQSYVQDTSRSDKHWHGKQDLKPITDRHDYHVTGYANSDWRNSLRRNVGQPMAAPRSGRGRGSAGTETRGVRRVPSYARPTVQSRLRSDDDFVYVDEHKSRKAKKTGRKKKKGLRERGRAARDRVSADDATESRVHERQSLIEDRVRIRGPVAATNSSRKASQKSLRTTKKTRLRNHKLTSTSITKETVVSIPQTQAARVSVGHEDTSESEDVLEYHSLDTSITDDRRHHQHEWAGAQNSKYDLVGPRSTGKKAVRSSVVVEGTSKRSQGIWMTSRENVLKQLIRYALVPPDVQGVNPGHDVLSNNQERILQDLLTTHHDYRAMSALMQLVNTTPRRDESITRPWYDLSRLLKVYNHSQAQALFAHDADQSSDVRLLFYGASPNVLAEIVQHGFTHLAREYTSRDEVPTFLLSEGLSLADQAFADQYRADEYEFAPGQECTWRVMACLVSMGQTHQAPASASASIGTQAYAREIARSSFDSVAVPAGRDPYEREFIVMSPQRIMPVYLLEYKFCPGGLV